PRAAAYAPAADRGSGQRGRTGRTVQHVGPRDLEARARARARRARQARAGRTIAPHGPVGRRARRGAPLARPQPPLLDRAPGFAGGVPRSAQPPGGRMAHTPATGTGFALSVERTIAAPPERVFDAFTQAQQLARWF